jgi:hypothetical protein
MPSASQAQGASKIRQRGDYAKDTKISHLSLVNFSGETELRKEITWRQGLVLLWSELILMKGVKW